MRCLQSIPWANAVLQRPEIRAAFLQWQANIQAQQQQQQQVQGGLVPPLQGQNMAAGSPHMGQALPMMTPGGTQVRPPAGGQAQGINPFNGANAVSANLHIPLNKQRNASLSGGSAGAPSPGARPPCSWQRRDKGSPVVSRDKWLGCCRSSSSSRAAAAGSAGAADGPAASGAAASRDDAADDRAGYSCSGGRAARFGPRAGSEITPAMMMNQAGGAAGPGGMNLSQAAAAAAAVAAAGGAAARPDGTTFRSMEGPSMMLDRSTSLLNKVDWAPDAAYDAALKHKLDTFYRGVRAFDRPTLNLLRGSAVS